MAPRIIKQNYEADKVYLYQFPRIKTCPSMSPYCLKVETLLRMYNIPHEVIYTFTKRSRNGTLPFIELNGEHIVDSDLIEMRLKKHFKILQLSKVEEAQSVAISRMVDNHLVYVLIRYKSAVPEFYSTFLSSVSIPSFLKSILLFLLPRFIKSSIRKRSNAAIGNFNDQELNEILHRDLTAIENLLKDDEKFLFGDKLTCADATVFGQLASTYYPFKNYIRQVIDKEYPRLKKYMEDVIEQVYPNDFTL